MAHARSPLLAALLTALAACGGGGGGGTPAGTCDAGQPGLCLVSCNLGCTASGCGILEIAQNQVLAFTFNRPLDPSTVANGAFTLATAQGAQPGGSFYVLGTTVTFVPETRVVGSATLFGFRANDTYQLSLRGEGDPRSLRAATGEVLGQGFTCALQVTRGIVDQDGKAPTADLLTPDAANRTQAPRDGQVVLVFSELLDVTNFGTANAPTAPVVFRVRKTRLENGIRVCDPSSASVLLEGGFRLAPDPIRQATLLTFTPALRLPIAACVEIEISERTKDLAGTPARAAVLTFTTQDEAPATLAVTEAFTDASRFDAAASAGTWGNGSSTPAVIGGDGLHGDFDPSDGVLVAPDHWLWSTDSQPIRAPVLANVTPPLTPVTDGVFRFATMVVPAGTTVEFRGSRPVRILVRGDLRIAGRVIANGIDRTAHDGNASSGQSGGPAGAGGGTGGTGGARGDGTGPGAGGAFSGSSGSDVQLPLGHAYAARALTTGGRGAPQYPQSGRNQDVTYGWAFGQFCAMVPAGGGGGGHATPGTSGKAFTSPTNELGPDGVAGIAFDPFPLPAATSSLDHFVVGGAGGGGAGSHALLSTRGFPTGPHWFSGAGGAGGGGALALRVGRDLVMLAGASLEVRGGSATSYGLPTIEQGPPAPGGGGAGGSVLLQVAASTALAGSIDLRGGTGGVWDLAPTLPMQSRAGDGAPGRVRFEAPSKPPLAALGTTLPPASAQDVDVLRDQDAVVGVQSLWYSTKQAFPPTWLHYVVAAEVAGQPRTFSDDATLGVFAGQGAGQALTVLVQGASVSPASGEVLPGSAKPWRDRVGTGSGPALADDACNGVRFLLLFDRRVASQCVVKSVTLTFRERP